MRLVVPAERAEGESRVALVPETVKKLVAAGFEISVERGAGAKSFYGDEAFEAAGAKLESRVEDLFGSADMILKVGAPTQPPGSSPHEVDLMKPGSLLLTSLMPTRNADAVRRLAARSVTCFSTDCIPRITRAQAMDTLSSMANIAGYKGVLLAAAELPKYFPMFMTAAGTVFAAKVFVIGAGVAGLQAIATARRIGAVVFATDVRPEVKEQVESVGAKYVGVELAKSAAAGGGYAGALSEQDAAKQRDMLADQCAVSDAVITTALIRGVTAPRLLGAETVRRMKPGSVIVDLAADGGGNCELSRPGQTVTEHGIRIVAPLNLPASMPTHASLLWSRNLANFLQAFWKDRSFQLDLNDEIQKACVVTHQGQILHAESKELVHAAG